MLFIMQQVSAQPSVNFKWSNFHRVHKFSNAIYLFKTIDGYGEVMTYNKSNRSFYKVSVYDSNLNLQSHRTFYIFKNKEKLLDINYVDNKIYFITEFDMINQRKALRYRMLNTDNLSEPLFKKDLLVLTETRFNRNLSYKVQTNDSFTSVWFAVPAPSENAKKQIRYCRFNSSMKKIDDALIDLNISNQLCEILRFEAGKAGDFFIYTKEYSVRRIEQRAFAPNYKFVFYHVNSDLTSINSCELKDEIKFLEKGRLKVNNGVLEATGFFAEKTDRAKEGIWFIKYDFNISKYIKDTLIYFDQKVKSLADNGFQASITRRSNLELFYLDYFIKANATDRILVAEQFMMIPASFGSDYTYNRFYGDILLLYIDQDSGLVTAQRILKSQETYNNFGEFSSYYLDRKDTVLNFYFNDYFQKIIKRKLKPLIWHKQSSLVVCKVTQNKIEKLVLSNYKEIDGIIQVRDMIPLGAHKYLVYAFKKKRGKLGILTINQ
jgi:hypothetical protein